MSQKTELFVTFLKIGAFTFGGGYAMIPLIEREVAEKKQKSIRKMNVPIIQKWNYGEFGMCGKDTLMHKY